MLVISDTNTVFSALLTRGKPLLVFEVNSLIKKFEFIAPEFLFFEIGKRLDKIIKFTHFSKEEFVEIFSFIKKEIELIPLKSFEDKVKEAKEIAPHSKDISFVALSLKSDCKILSGDNGLKRVLPNKVISPSEALNILFDSIKE